MGYVDEQLVKKYTLPIVGTMVSSAITYMMAADEDSTGEVETSKQQAATDARQEFMDKMTLSGTKCEGYERMDKNLEKIVIGQITKIEKHPDADKLIICQVNIGTEEIQIVTGAPNVKVGDKVPVVLDGGKVAGGHDGGPLRKTVLRSRQASSEVFRQTV